MAIIEVAGLVKEFRSPKRFSGPLGGVRTLLTRQYMSKLAVDGVDFSVEEGEIVAYLGPNGAGKSTTIKILTGILQPTAGQVHVAGLVPWRHRQRNALNIGVVFGQRSQLWWDLPLLDSLELIGKLYGMERSRHTENIARFTEVLDLGPFLQTPVRQLSLGQRMRGDLAAAMLHEPTLLYLDEPTIGLDVVAKTRIRDFIGVLNRDEGTTVILTTHDLDDVERLCSRIILIDGGKVLYDGDVDALKSDYARHRQLVVQLDGEPRWHGAFLAGLQGDPEVSLTDPGTLVLRFDPERTAVSDLIGAVMAGCPVRDLSIVEPALEDVIHRIYSASSVS
ncbi:ATP-binding cassette domain-containing protein [Streptomyces sp. BE147]|uniref:ABC transporter ATP-binding protein n=1 Tax=unclassified Streptomyces TaxID=2593676 RepID=UPI002E762EB6|nr:ATP-binding cassette domain-containing protein [Streptomyces sp. BE147]MEE1736693.1 ATP-binding cassette domain-containing protein [Streptomyces sp. BE147]